MTNRMLASPASSAAFASRSSRIAIRAAGVTGFALLTAAAAQVAIPLPNTPVPITLQTLAVVLAGVTLGPLWGAASMAFYLLLGTVGYEVFAFRSWGLTTLLGATGGYLLGFVLMQPVIGAVLSSSRRAATAPPSRLNLLIALVAGQFVLFACGVAWLAAWLGVDLARALDLGFWPFLLGGAIKTALAIELGRWSHAPGRRWIGW